MESFQTARRAGILMPVASLPGPYGIGNFGRPAYDFVDFLAKAGQRYWQILPIGPTGYGDSPYQSFSAFSGNPYFIDPDILREQGLLTKAECEEALHTCGPIDYAWLYDTRLKLLHKAAARMKETPDFSRFCAESPWLENFVLFMSIKGEHGDVSWQDWPDNLRMRDENAMAQARERLRGETDFWRKTQYWFYRQWESLKRYANEQGIAIVGDIPIYVSPDSSDVWADSALFQLDSEKRQTRVAGVPPDAFSADGQVWGNPLYDWAHHQQTGFAWWVGRLRHAAAIYDVTRIDHFRGFQDYFAVPAGDDTAKNGDWQPGPGKDFVEAIQRQLPQLAIIAEDLGYLSPQVAELLRFSGYPGMKVLQFAFDSREAGNYLPYHYPVNSVVYTGTHDNTTTADWAFSAPPSDVAFARKYLDSPPEKCLTTAMVRAAMASVSFLAVIPLQDWLVLGKEARINTPATLGGNWMWRADPMSLTDKLAAEIADMTTLYGRC